jgi:hypothetical protein
LRVIARRSRYDIVTVAFVVAILSVAILTFKDYAISNDEGVQHHYGELILAYYSSGFKDQSVFNFQNLYLYGGLFDVVAVATSYIVPINAYDLRHILSALVGIGGICAVAATARLIAGPRAGLLAAVALCSCGVWYGAMFNHTKDIPFAAAMMGATLFLIRIGRRLPSPGAGDLTAFGLLAGAALGTRVLGLLLVPYIGIVVTLCQPRCEAGTGNVSWRSAIISMSRMLPALILAYFVMILAWPWAALAPLNPVRALLTFSEFHYNIRTIFVGEVYDMADVPRLYVPVYILIRIPLLILFGAGVAMMSMVHKNGATASDILERRDTFLLSMTVVVPIACHVIGHGPAFTGLRHFLFIIPPLAVLAGIGLDKILTFGATRGRSLGFGSAVLVSGFFVWNAATLVRLHPDEYLFYNLAVGGLEGATRKYDLDYWFNSMPEAISKLESYLRASADPSWRTQTYSVAVCGERLSFEKAVTLPQLRYDFMPTWSQSDFFIAPTQMNCDNDLDGKVVATVERLGVVIAYVKDRRASTRPLEAAVK